MSHECCPQVYGTKNLRIADLSVVPLQVGSHTQSKCHVSFLAVILMMVLARYRIWYW